MDTWVFRSPQVCFFFFTFTLYWAFASVSTCKGYEMWQVEHALLGPVSHALSHPLSPPPPFPPSLVSYSTLTMGRRWITCRQQRWELDRRSPDLLPAAHLWTGPLQSTRRVFQHEPLIWCNITHTDELPYPEEIKRAERRYHLRLHDTDLFTVRWFQTIHLSHPRWITLWIKITLLLRCQSTTDGRF